MIDHVIINQAASIKHILKTVASFECPEFLRLSQ